MFSHHLAWIFSLPALAFLNYSGLLNPDLPWSLTVLVSSTCDDNRRGKLKLPQSLHHVRKVNGDYRKILVRAFLVAIVLRFY